MYWKTLLLIFTILPSSLYCAWPFSSEGIVEICAVELCDCTEPNIRCANHNFTEVNLVLPDDTDVVDFSRNMVKKIDGLHKWPKSIIEINLSRNQIFQINQNVFDTFTLLENLDLSYNKIGFINATVLHKLASLNSLDLSHNLLISIDPDWFGTQNNLIRMNIGYNPLNDLTNESFQNLPWLEYLDVSNTSIDELPLKVFHNNTRMKELRLARNSLDHIPITQLNCIKDTLELLDLSGTNLTKIANHEFHKMYFLRKLFLNDMRHLRHIEPVAFNGLELEVIEIKNNPKLEYIDEKAFYNSYADEIPNRVQNLDLSNNALRTLSEILLNWTDTNVILNGNQWNCDCQLAWMLDLKLNDLVTCATPDDLKNEPIANIQVQDLQCTGMRSILKAKAIRIVLIMCLSVFILMILMSLLLLMKPHLSYKLQTTNIFKRMVGVKVQDEPSQQYVRLHEQL